MTEYENMCMVGCAAGPNGEMLLCGFKPGHEGPHAWATLPTFVDGKSVREHELLTAVNELYGSFQSLLGQIRTLDRAERWVGPVLARRVLRLQEPDWEALRRNAELSHRTILTLIEGNASLDATLAQLEASEDRGDQDVAKIIREMRAVL
jgi:hypothetical protein